MIRVDNIKKNFGDFQALKSVSLEFPKGEISVVSGADGAGKSTLFKIILGLLKRDSGDIFINNSIIGNNFSIITEISGYMPERFSLYPDLTVNENLNFFADIYGVGKVKREELKKRLLETTGMNRFKNRRAAALSGGMKQKLALSTILLSSPEVIFLDEPTTGVDPLSRIEFFSIIESLKREGKTIIMSTPYLDEAEKGDRIFFLKHGSIIKSGKIEEMKRDVPFKIFRLKPKGNVFEIVENAKNDERLKNRVFIKGKYLKFISSGEDELISIIPHTEMKETIPSLEDIYLYYENIRESVSERNGNG